jgi:hypothetical protein
MDAASKDPSKAAGKKDDKKDALKDDPAKDPALDKINQDITDKVIGDGSGIDPFLLRIDKIDKLDLALVTEEARETDESPAKEGTKLDEQKPILTE